MDQLSGLREAILNGDASAAASAANVALAAGVSPVDVIADGISPAMAEVGQLFEEGEYFVPELLIAARATKEVFAILRPLLAETGAKSAGRVLLGTVEGDLHDIGKNLVGAMLEGAGFEVVDLGVDIPRAAVRRGRSGGPAADRGDLGASHDHDAGDEDHARGPRRGRAAVQRQGHGRRRARHPAIRRLDRGRRLRRDRDGGGGSGPAADRAAQPRSGPGVEA